MKVLITGGAGFIGSHLVEHFQGQAQVVVLDNLRTGTRENLRGFNVDLVEADIADRKAVRWAVNGATYVFHLAAMVSVPESMAAPLACVRTNVEGTLVLLEEATRAEVNKLCFSSSCAIYGDRPENPKTEAVPPAPMSPYAMSKLDGEFYCNLFQRQGLLNTAVMRYFNVFGPRQDPQSPYAAAIPRFISKACHGEALCIYGSGEQTRDFVYVKDVVAANLFLARSEHSGIYNVGSGTSRDIKELAQTIVRLTGSRSPIVYEAERPGDIRHSLSSPDKLKALNFQCSHAFDAALKKTIASFKV